jgi:predicted permease
MQSIWHDLNYGLRSLRRSPGFTIVSILTIALGIGANTAIFSYINPLILRQLPGVVAPTELVQVLQTRDGRIYESISYLDFLDYQAQNSSFAGMAMYDNTYVHLNAGQEAERLFCTMVNGSYFAVLGVKSALGRLILPDDVLKEGEKPVAVLSHALWRNRFAGDLQIIGKTISLNGYAYTVVGVAAEGFSGTVIGERTDIWIPITMWQQADPEAAVSAVTWKTDWFGQRDAAWLKVFGRLKPEVRIEKAQTDLSTIAQRLALSYPQTNEKVGVRLEGGLGLPYALRSRVSQYIKLPIIIVGIVLLIVCANVAGMFLTRANARQKEIGIRLALGAKGLHIIRQLLTESLLLALCGGVAGLFFGIWLSDRLRLLLPGAYLNARLNLDTGLDARVFWFTLGVSLLTGVIVGLAPARQALKQDLASTLTGRHGFYRRSGRIRLRDILLITQTALSLLLLVAAGLCIRSLRNARAIDTGFDTDRVLTARVDLGRQNYTQERGEILYRELIERMETMPGVQSASLALNMPLSGPQLVTRIHPEGRPFEKGPFQVSYNVVTPHYFETVGIQLLLGRGISAQDNRQSPLVAIVNERLAQNYWPNENPIGKRFRFGAPNSDNPLIEIVGVAANTKVSNIFAPPRMYFYLPLSQHYQNQSIVHLRASGEPERLITAIRREISNLDRSLPIYEVKTFTAYLNDALAPQRLATFLVSGFGVLAVILAAIGLYGALSYDVSQRTHEIGVRMALGAQPRDVLRLIIRKGMTLTFIGTAIGIGAALVMTRLIESLLYGVSATDPLTFVVIAALLVLVGLLACYTPARRAIQVDPLQSLRSE